nr:kinase [Actinomycetales bacterium]
MPPVIIPPEFRARIAGRPALPGRSPDGGAWLARLPHLIAEYLERWRLRVDGEPRSGENALVVPVLRASGEQAAVKLTWPHPEAEWEHLALRLWEGKGAVRMLAADPREQVLLLERLDADRPLTREFVIDACEVVGSLMLALDLAAPPQVESLASRAGRLRDGAADPTPLVPRRLQDQAHSTVVDLLTDPPPARLVHEDLHDANVLAPIGPGRGEWLAIDPKP